MHVPRAIGQRLRPVDRRSVDLDRHGLGFIEWRQARLHRECQTANPRSRNLDLPAIDLRLDACPLPVAFHSLDCYPETAVVAQRVSLELDLHRQFLAAVAGDRVDSPIDLLLRVRMIRMRRLW